MECLKIQTIQTKYVVRTVDGRESDPFDSVTAAVAHGILTRLPFDRWSVEPAGSDPIPRFYDDDRPGLPKTTVTVGGRNLVFLGHPGPLLPIAVRCLEDGQARI